MSSESHKSPTYYSEFDHEPWDIMYERWGAGALLSHALKYILRAGRKTESPMLHDVQKAIQYLQHLERKIVEKPENDSALKITHVINPGESER
jgi:hypothetical protein